MSRISLLHDSAPYTGATAAASLRGTESTLARFAEALAQRGHEVAVYNGVKEHSKYRNVSWRPLAERRDQSAGVAISVNKARLFNGVTAPTKILWSHNPATLSRLIRKDGFIALYRHRPHLVVMGAYHASRISRLLPFRSRRVLYHGSDVPADLSHPWTGVPAPRAVFSSVPYRGAAWVAGLWPEVRDGTPAAELDIYASALPGISAGDVPGGVKLRGTVPREVLLRELRAARVMLLPGHRDETFCMAAAEATEIGVPIVTLGIGSLRERVKHGVTGYIATNREEFIAYARAILSDDVLWRRLNKNCIEDRSLTNWDKCAEAWERNFFAAGDTAAGEYQAAVLASSS